MERPHYHGHRKRLRERFLKNGLAGFAEHEVVELLLTLAIPRADVKQPAKALLKRFGSLRGVLDATLSELRTLEVDVSLEKDDYFLAGKVNVLFGGDGKLELLDFKTSPRPRNSPGLIAAYERQLCTYAHILERRHGRHVDPLLLYWTSEARKEDSLMVLPYRPEQVDEAGRHFDATVGRIRAGEFSVTTPPEAVICRGCDLRTLCRAEGVIGEIGDSEALAA